MQGHSKIVVKRWSKVKNVMIIIVYFTILVLSFLIFNDPRIGMVISIALCFLFLPFYAIVRSCINFQKRKTFERSLLTSQVTLNWLERIDVNGEELRIPLLNYIEYFLNQNHQECFEELVDHIQLKLRQSSFNLNELAPDLRACIEEERFSFDPVIKHIAEAYYILLKDPLLTKEKVKKVVQHLLKTNAYADSHQLNNQDQFLKSCLEHF